MNKNLLKKLALASMLLVTSSLSVFSKQNNNTIIYDAIEQNGVLIGQTLYKCDDNKLEQFVKYNYIYDNNDRIIENNITKWNKERNSWEKSISVKYAYQNNTITKKYYIWNENSHRYKLLPNMSKTIHNCN